MFLSLSLCLSLSLSLSLSVRRRSVFYDPSPFLKHTLRSSQFLTKGGNEEL